MSQQSPVAIMAGGTGGHIFPGIAVGRELVARGVPVVWLGSNNGLETRLVPAAGFVLETVTISALRGKNWAGPFMAVKWLWGLLMAVAQLLKAVIHAMGILRRVRPRSVLSLGGFAAGPSGVAAWVLGLPMIVHEQNRVPGLTNRWLARLSKKVLCGFVDAFPTRTHALWVGNPVRREIGDLLPPAQRLIGRDGPVRLLVLGGSQGSHALNVAFPQALGRLPAALKPQIRHQCGVHHLERARRGYGAARVDVTVEAFIEDMAQAYAWADLVICRAGALTLAELCAAGIGAVLVPFPKAADDHQTRNAQVLVEQGAAVLVQEGLEFESRLAAAVAELVTDPARRLTMAQAARALAKPDAAQRIADVCLEVAA